MKPVLIFLMGIIFMPNVYAQEEFDEEFVDFILSHIESINELLVQADEEYSNGNKDLAMKLATTAYLEHYEYIESELGLYDEELIEDVEWAMREELRGMIKDGVPASEVSLKVNEILEKLQDIGAIVPEFGTIVMMILAVTMISMVAITSKSRFSTRV